MKSAARQTADGCRHGLTFVVATRPMLKDSVSAACIACTSRRGVTRTFLN